MGLGDFLAEQLYGVHAFLAGLSGIELLKIEQEEADKLGTAFEGVARHYEIPGASQKTIDWVRLMTALGTVYGTRLFAYNAMVATREKAKQPPEPQPRPSPAPVVRPMTIDPTSPPRPASMDEQPQRRTTYVTPVPGLPAVRIDE